MLLHLMNDEWRRVGSGLTLCCLLFTLPSLTQAQNLVPNPSFEVIDSCPQWPILLNFTPGARPAHWFSISESPDYFNVCVDTLTGIPSNALVFQHAFDGDAYSGMIAYSSLGLDRELIGCELVTPLMVGQTYYASFYVNAGFGGEVLWPTRATNNFGLLFTMSANEWVYPMPPFALRDYAHVRSTQVVTDTIGWTLISGSFVADSAYRYMVVGNHFGDAETLVQQIGADTVLGFHQAYTLVDLICVSTEPGGCSWPNGMAANTATDIKIFPNPAQNELVVVLGQTRWRIAVIRDILGRVVWRQQLEGRGELRLDIESWATGQYFLSVSGEQHEQTLRFAVF